MGADDLGVVRGLRTVHVLQTLSSRTPGRGRRPASRFGKVSESASEDLDGVVLLVYVATTVVREILSDCGMWFAPAEAREDRFFMIFLAGTHLGLNQVSQFGLLLVIGRIVPFVRSDPLLQTPAGRRSAGPQLRPRTLRSVLVELLQKLHTTALPELFLSSTEPNAVAFIKQGVSQQRLAVFATQAGRGKIVINPTS